MAIPTPGLLLAVIPCQLLALVPTNDCLRWTEGIIQIPEPQLTSQRNPLLRFASFYLFNHRYGL